MDLNLGSIRASLRRPTFSRRAVMVSLVLTIVFSIAILMRTFAAKYGFYLNEFDPYYDYYAASHIVTLAQEHGIIYAFFNNPANCGPNVLTACHLQQGYFHWHDIQTWFPYGRNVAATSQDGLQVFGALTYLLVHNVFGVPISLYDFIVVLPVFLGSVTAIVFFFVLRRIAGDAAGLFGALMIAVSPPLIERGNLGWFKSEPLAILLFTLASFYLLTVFDKERPTTSRVWRATLAGFLAGYANTAWGGGDYFTGVFGLLFLLLPFINVDLSSISTSVVCFSAAAIFGSAIFPRPGITIVTNPVGLALVGGTVFVLVAQWTKSWVRPTEYRKTLIKFLLAFGLGGLAVLSFGLVGGISERYLSAIAPWVRANNPLAQSVAEEAVPTGQDYFTAYLILLSFGVAGALIAFRRRSAPMLYALIIGLTGLYFSAAYARLLVYSSLSLAMLGGIGFAELAFALTKPSSASTVKKRPAATSRNEMRVVFSVAILALIVIPAGTYWIPNPVQCTSSNTYFCDQSPADSGVSLSNGATAYTRSPFPDWTDALQWLRQNTPTDSVVLAWWDYGYWIAVMGNRSSVVDNATLNGTRIAEVGQMFFSNTTQALQIAEGMSDGRPTYVLMFITGSIIPVTDQTTGTTNYYYVLQVPAGGGFTAGGGDESKKQWFIRIGGVNESEMLSCVNVSSTCPSVDDFNLTPYADQNTLFGQMLPFRFTGYLVSSSSSIQEVSTYQFGQSSSGTLDVPPVEAYAYPYTPYFGVNSSNGMRLAYASPSLAGATSVASAPSGTAYACPGNSNLACFNAILVYQVVS